MEHNHKALNKAGDIEYLALCVEESSRLGNLLMEITKY